MLICCTCHFQSSSLLFVFFFFFSPAISNSFQYLASALTQGGEGGYLLSLTCSVELQEGRDTKRKPNRVCALVGVPENLNLSGLDLGSARNPGPALDSSPADHPGA